MGTNQSQESFYTYSDLKNLKILNKFEDKHFGTFYSAEYNDNGFLKQCYVKEILCEEKEAERLMALLKEE